MPTTAETLRGVSVLVVEDEALIAEEIRARLTRLGAQVVDTVDTGEEAIAAAAKHRPRVTLMDVRLKGSLDGIDAADEIRRSSGVPVVFLTAHSDRDTLRRAKGTDPFGYVLKPFHERDLVVALEMALHRSEIEERLRESERRYAATLASIGDGVVATDADGRVTFVNPVAEALTRWRHDEALGLDVDQVLPTLDESTRSMRQNPAIEALASGETLKLDGAVVLVSRNNELVPIDVTAARIMTEEGKVLGTVVAFRDIRPRRLAEDAIERAEEQLRRAQKLEAVGRLAGGVAHDFNNLLFVISGYSEILLDGADLDGVSHEMLSGIRRAADRAAELTRQLLAFGRRQTLKPARLDLAALVDDLREILSRLLREDMELKISSAPALASIEADAAQLEQVILNLALNARDAMPDGGRLTIELSNADFVEPPDAASPEIRPGRFVRLAVTDTGTGMDASVLEHIFEPFFSTKELGKGTGLGLATVHGIVRQSGGFLRVESAPGKGTRFELFFPALASAADVMPRAAAAAPAGPRGTERILLVEDDDTVRSLVAAALRLRGYDVCEAGGGEEAIARHASRIGEIDLLVSDLVMPGLGGRDLATKLRSRKPRLRCLYLSGYSGESAGLGELLDVDSDFLQKPVPMAVLATRIRELLDR